MQNKIDVIYIDPPYNTGNKDFVYPDKFEYSDNQLKEIFGLTDEELERLDSIKSSSSHSAWLTFMYPRIILAKKLLKDTGIMFVSIDDNEQSNLKIMMDEIFGETSFVGQFVWKKTETPSNLSKFIKKSVEYVLCYKGKDLGKIYGKTKKQKSSNGMMNQTNSYHELKFPANTVLTNMKDQFFKSKEYGTDKYKIELLQDAEVKNGIFITPVILRGKFKWSQVYLDKQIKDNVKISIQSKSFSPSYEKGYYEKESPSNLIDKNVEVETNEEASKNLQLLMNNSVFSYPKPVSLIKYLINMNPNKNITVLDFFAGSGTTADAVMQLNSEDGGKRKFILAQLHEPTFEFKNGLKVAKSSGSENALNAGYKYIDEITMQRIKNAYKKINGNYSNKIFNHYTVIDDVSTSILDNMKSFREQIIDDNKNAKQTTMFNDILNTFSANNLGVHGDATGQDIILTTWLVKDGYSFDVNKEKIKFGSYEATLVDNSRLYLIDEGWDKESTRTLINKLGNRKLNIQTIVLFGYSFNIAELKELEIALKELDNKVNLVKRY